MSNKQTLGRLVVAACLAAVAVEAAVVGDWKMNEGTGAIVADSSGHGYDFSPVGSGTGTGYSWTSVSGGLTAANPNDSCLTTTVADNLFQYQVAVEAWIKPTAVDTDGSKIVSLLDGFALEIVNGGTQMRFITCNSYNFYGVYADTPKLLDGNFHHVLGVFDGTRDGDGKIKLSFFYDGVQTNALIAVASDTKVGWQDTGLTGTAMYIGQNAWFGPSMTTQNYMGDISGLIITNVPEPVTISLLALGGLVLLRRRNA